MKSLKKSTQALLVLDQINQWKTNKGIYKKMPEDLWQQAIGEAKIHGVSCVAFFFNIGRIGLVSRMSAPVLVPIKKQKVAALLLGFVKLSPLPELPKAQPLEVRLTGPGGQSADIRGTGSSADWEKLFSAWFRASIETVCESPSC